MTDWSAIVQKHAPIVWKTVYRLLGNEADAEDCFQNTFVAALEVSQRQSVRNWPGLLKRLATVSALERLRQRYRRSGRETGLPENSLVDRNATDPAREAEAGELADRLREALARLDTRQAEAVTLVCFHGFSYRQIAEQLDVSVNHVGVILRRARETLRTQLQIDETRSTGREAKRRSSDE